MLYFHTHYVHLCKSTISEKKKSLLIPCSQMQRQCESESHTEGTIGRKVSRQGIGRFRAKLPFCLLVSHTDMQTALPSKCKGIFFPFFFFFYSFPLPPNQITNSYHRTPQPCIVYLSTSLCQSYRKEMEVLQCSLT